MKMLKGGMALALIVAGCAGNSGVGLLATETQTFATENLTVTVGFTEMLDGCRPTGAMLQNARTTALGYTYAQLFAVKSDGRTVGAWSISFPPTIGGGSAKAAAINGNSSTLTPCGELHFHISV
jgi:hypothetical protein